jgi:chromosome segregation ATPase
MFKKMAIAALAVVAGLFILNTTYFGSYAKTAWKKAKSAANHQVPLEFKIETLRNEIAQLIPDMRKNISALAEEIVAVDKLQREVTEVRANLGLQKDNLRAMKEALQTGDTRVDFRGTNYPVDKLKTRLDREFNTCKQREKDLEVKEAMLEARRDKLAADRDQLEGMKSQKAQLELRVQQLDTELRTLRAVQTRSRVQFDDSRLARIKNELSHLEDQLKVERTASDLLSTWQPDGDIRVESQAKSSDQIIKEVDDYLGDSPKNKVAADKR